MTEIKKELIFLTACVNPNGMAFTALQDAEIRYSQYVETINFYLKKTSLRILVVENSGIDISGAFVDEISDKRIEILTFQGNSFDRSLGKGYGEMLIIEHALKNSVFFNQANFIFKITGRCKILNIEKVLGQFYKSAPDLQMLVDLNKFPSYSDSRFWGAQKEFYGRLVEHKGLVNDSKGFYFEHALYKTTREFIAENFKHSFLKNLPRYSGIFATKNTPYPDSWLYWYPRNVKYNLLYYFRKGYKALFNKLPGEQHMMLSKGGERNF